MRFNDEHCRNRFQPFSRTRRVEDIRAGILTIRQKWELLAANSGHEAELDNVVIPSDLLPSLDTFERFVAAEFRFEDTEFAKAENVFDPVRMSARLIEQDFAMLTGSKTSAPIDASNILINADRVFLEEGAIVSCSVLNASAGPIYIGRGAEIMEGCFLRGPVSIGANSVVKMGAKIYGGTSIGPNCVVGGEIKNSIIQGYSNKAHDGYLGDSMIGEWCNLGAGTSNSNVKNTGGAVTFHFTDGTMISAGNKGGLLMGDYTRCAINTSFNTGTVAGVCCNIFGEAGKPSTIADFTWGTERYVFEKALRDISNWKKMKGCSLSHAEEEQLKTIYFTK